MDIRVTIHAGPAIHLRSWRRTLKRSLTRVRPSVMETVAVAVLTKLRGFTDEHGPMVAAMHIVAGQAVFCDRLMLKPEGPPFFSMAGVAEFIDNVCFDHFGSKAAVGVVTVSAIHLSFLYGVM